MLHCDLCGKTSVDVPVCQTNVSVVASGEPNIYANMELCHGCRTEVASQLNKTLVRMNLPAMAIPETPPEVVPQESGEPPEASDEGP